MNLYLISQTEKSDYNTYDSAVVAAESEYIAQRTLPYGGYIDEDQYEPSWVNNPQKVKVKLIGIAISGMATGVICASFNA